MIYTTFKQWVKGRFLETGEPRKKAYSKDELALIEMGWGYGYDAGVEWQKRQTALDKKADNARDLGLDYEPVDAIKEALETKDEPVALVAEVHISRFTIEWTNGPLPEGTKLYTTPQRTWVVLTDEEKAQFVVAYYPSNWDRKTAVSLMNDYEKYLKERNT